MAFSVAIFAATLGAPPVKGASSLGGQPVGELFGSRMSPLGASAPWQHHPLKRSPLEPSASWQLSAPRRGVWPLPERTSVLPTKAMSEGGIWMPDELDDCPGSGDVEMREQALKDLPENTLIEDPTKKCNRDTNRVCAQLLEGTEKIKFGEGKDGGDFWNIVTTSMTPYDLIRNGGDSWCVSLRAYANLITIAGCENVNILCGATDVDHALAKFESGKIGVSPFGLDLQATAECLRKKCKTDVSLAADDGVSHELSAIPFFGMAVVGGAVSAIAVTAMGLLRGTSIVSAERLLGCSQRLETGAPPTE